MAAKLTADAWDAAYRGDIATVQSHISTVPGVIHAKDEVHT